MSERTIRVGLRELTAVMAGLRTFADGGALDVDAARRHAPTQTENRVQQFLRRNLHEGRLPVSIDIVRDAGSDDDWAELRFGDPDPAIAPFR